MIQYKQQSSKVAKIPHYFIAIFVLLFFCGFSYADNNRTAKIGKIIYHDDFKNPINWTKSKGIEFKQKTSGNILFIDNGFGEVSNADSLIVSQDAYGRHAKTKKKSKSISCDITKFLKKYAGYEIEVFVDVKADKVPSTGISWEGVRVVLNTETLIRSFGSAANGLYGSFDWKTCSFKMRLPTDLTKAKISLGMISDSGTAQIRNIRIVTTDISRAVRVKDAKFNKPIYKGHSLPRLRGLNTSIVRKIDDITKNWKANVMKYTMAVPSPNISDSEVEAYIKSEQKKIDKVIKIISPTGAYLIIQMHLMGYAADKTKGTSSDLFYVIPAYSARFAKCWEMMAEHYKNEHEVLWGFELLNESKLRISKPYPGCPDYEGLMEMAAKKINTVDPKRTIIVQPEEWYGMMAFYKLRPIKADNIVYAVHFYAPFKITHQNLFKPGKPIPYPGKYDSVYWDKEALRKEMAPALEFQKAYNVHMFVSEFSCIRWAPGSDKWLDDAISLFEEYRWDWMFHDIYAWPGWNPELGPDRNNLKPVANNPRELVLKKWMSGNTFKKRISK